MTPEQTKSILDVLRQADEQTSARRIADLESHLDASDRVIAQVGQLKLLNEGDGLTPVALALMEAARGADPT